MGESFRNIDARAQSESIGVIMLTAVIVLLVGGFGVVYLGASGAGSGADTPLVDAEVTVTDQQVTITHVGGDTIPTSELDVIVRANGGSERFSLDAVNISEDTDGSFGPSDRFERDHGLGGGQLDVLLVHTTSNTVLHHAYLDTSDAGETTLATFSYQPTDPEPGESLTFDASQSRGVGGVSTYEWDWDGDGTVEDTTSSPTIQHTFGSSGGYDVTLRITDGEGNTDETTGTLVVDDLRAAATPGATTNGINYQYYEASGQYPSMPDFGAETPTRTGVTDQVDLDPNNRDDEFAFRYTGYVEVPQDGQYTFSTTSDDGSEFYVGDELVVDNGGTHANRTRSGQIGLKAGKHPITVTMFEHTGQAGLELSWSGPGVTDGTVPASALFRRDAPIAAFSRSCAGRDCTFDASGSSNPGGSIDSYEWDFGDGDSATGSSVTHTYDSTGSYTASLTVTGDGGGTDTREETFTVSTLLPALSPGPVTQGVDYEFYEASGTYTSLDEVDWSSPTRTGTTDAIDFDPIDTDTDNVAMRYQTYLDVPANDTYTFYTTSDDGSRLHVDGQLVVDNPGLHPAEEQSGQVALEEGYHNVTVTWFEHTGNVALSASYESSAVQKQELPAGRLYRSARQVRWETATDWDGASAESGVVHEAFGDREAAAVELGYPSGGRWGPTPVAYWPLDEDSGSTTADVVGSNDGSIQGATIGIGGTLDTSTYDFDGSDDYVSGATDIAALQGTASMSFWVNTTQRGEDTVYQAPGVTGVESNGDQDDVFWGWIDQDGHIGVTSGNDLGAQSTSVVADGEWHHVVLTRAAGTGDVQVYVDGTLEDSVSARSGTIGNSFDSLGRIEDTGTSPEYFDGRLEDVQVYDSVLSSSDAQTLADATDGRLMTGTKAFGTAIDPSGLSLQNVSASLPAGTSVNVTVHSDPDGDGTFEETSAVIDLSPGTTTYAVSGLSSQSATYRLEVELQTTDPKASPAVDRLELGA